MPNKELQEQRMRGYFIQATKEILRGEGLQHVSVRNVAEKAGYSYATLYNYFRDIKDLIFECVKDFLEEATEFIENQVKKNVAPGKDRIRAISKAYMNYFIEYPGIFELFFIEKMTNMAGKQPTDAILNSYLKNMTESDWNYCLENNELTEEQISEKQSLLNYFIIGSLLTYLHRNQPHSYKDFIEMRDAQIEVILN